MMMLRAALLLMALALPARAEMAIQEVTSPSGLKAWLVQDDSIPFMALELRFRGGMNLDPADRRGAVNLMTALIEEGTGDLDSRAFAAARDDLAAQMTFRATQDAVTVSARFLTENRDQAVDLLRQALTAPRFDAEAVERVRAQVIAGIESDAKDPQSIAGRVWDGLTWNADSPYATSGDGTVDSVAALTRDDLVAAHAAALARDQVYIAAAGDISADDLGRLIDALLGGLPETGAPLPPPADYRLTGGVTVEDFPVPQSLVLFGHQGIARDDPDFMTAFVLNEAMAGGGFNTRLMNELRVKRGLTYGIGTYLAPGDLGNLYIGQFASDNARVAEAIDLVRAEWARVAAEGLTEEELARTKTYLTGAYPLRFDGNGAIASILVGMQYDGLPIDYPVTRNALVEAVTMDDIRRVAARLYRADDLHFVVVGQPQGLTAGQ